MFPAPLISTLRPSPLLGLLLASLVVAAGGCVQVSHTSVASVGGEERGAQLDRAPNADRVAALAEELIALGPGVTVDEAMSVAEVAVHYSEELADFYDMVRPVEVHNVLVNMRLRRGGLCYQMAECMLAELRELPLHTLELRRGIAWKDDLWNEHNCVVVTAVGAPFESGVVLDAWRNGGRLRWAPVLLDHYPWQTKPPPASETLVASRDAVPEEPLLASQSEQAVAEPGSPEPDDSTPSRDGAGATE